MVYCSHIGCRSVLCFVFVKKYVYCVGSCMFFQPYDRRTIPLHIELVHTGSFILTKYLYPNIFPMVLHLMWLANGSTLIVYF